MKKVILLFLMVLSLTWPFQVCAQENKKTEDVQSDEQKEEQMGQLNLTAKSAVLMECSTGKIIYQEKEDEALAPASVTKVMTLLLIFDALKDGKIKLKQNVTVSDYAASMGGSQVFLEPGESQSVETLIKCITVASANDACVAMAEQISGSEDGFVKAMNKRAKGLGMKHTCFKNCNGLDTDGHVISAKDIAIMSRELMVKYPDIKKYTNIWMENIVHHTKKGDSEFGLSNTNKLLKLYQYTTGLKTGSTGKAGFCISATAKKEEVELIAVVMGEENTKLRNQDAIKLLNYGFSKCNLYQDDKKPERVKVPVTGGVKGQVCVERKSAFHYVDTSGANLNKIQKKTTYKKKITAPVKKGETLGKIAYYLEQKKIGESEIIALQTLKKMNYPAAIRKICVEFLL